MCAQQFDGGLRDKPSKSRDFYHTCYNLSGLSASQHLPNKEIVNWGSMSNVVRSLILNLPIISPSFEYLSCCLHQLAEVHPAFNIRATAADNALRYFSSQPTGHDTLVMLYEEATSSLDMN